MRRRALIAGNWKMNLGRVDDALALVRRLRPLLDDVRNVDVLLCPPFTVLAGVAEVLRPSRIALGAQNLHWQAAGAQTGEISPAMLRGLCSHVLVGHSERRAAGESDSDVARKVVAALEHDLLPILCCGENLEEREAGCTDEILRRQIEGAFGGLSTELALRSIVAYEPVWAIGTGRSASAAEANRVIGLTLRGGLAEIFGEGVAERIRILYGGSVNAGNITALLTQPEVDGALVGGASLDASFADLVREADRVETSA